MVRLERMSASRLEQWRPNLDRLIFSRERTAGTVSCFAGYRQSGVGAALCRAHSTGRRVWQLRKWTFLRRLPLFRHALSGFQCLGHYDVTGLDGDELRFVQSFAETAQAHGLIADHLLKQVPGKPSVAEAVSLVRKRVREELLQLVTSLRGQGVFVGRTEDLEDLAELTLIVIAEMNCFAETGISAPGWSG